MTKVGLKILLIIKLSYLVVSSQISLMVVVKRYQSTGDKLALIVYCLLQGRDYTFIQTYSNH